MPIPETRLEQLDWFYKTLVADKIMSRLNDVGTITDSFSVEERAIYLAKNRARSVDKYGEMITNIKDCVEEENAYDPEKLWVDRFWQESGVVHLTAAKWDKYIATSKKGDKPWLILMGNSPYGNPANRYQTTETLLGKVSCVARFDEKFNVGFVDYYADEFVMQSIDPIMRQHGQQAPYTIVVDEGKVYHSLQRNY